MTQKTNSKLILHKIHFIKINPIENSVYQKSNPLMFLKNHKKYTDELKTSFLLKSVKIKIDNN